MATLILRDTHRALEKKMKSLDKLKKETSLKIRDAASHGDLKEKWGIPRCQRGAEFYST